MGVVLAVRKAGMDREEMRRGRGRGEGGDRAKNVQGRREMRREGEG